MPSRRPRRADLPAFALYGEQRAAAPAMLHVESIASRSRLYDWEIDSHVHHGLHQLLWLRAGPVQARLDESRTEAEGPLAIAIPPAVAHAFRFTPETDGMVLTLDARRLAEGEPGAFGQALQSLFALPRVVRVPAHEAGRLQALMAALHTETLADESSPVPTWLARSVVWRLAQLAQRSDASAPSDQAEHRARDAIYTRWLVLLEAHYREHWPVARYAERLGLSTERLNRLVRAETGLNAQALLHARLFREACRRLVHVAAPVSRIGFELGFDDPAYFCRFFKRHAGVGPREYRQRVSTAAG
ncbi:MAG: helix-turn-helix domain-containing protein [Burkholderiaceae bacterium]|nr:helix-turn-helix domain-containing protein [Rhodoferax sp.]MCP5284080.1 helix-turn-helix domain-containing protein [Burkholderiaceae bacterium]